MTTMETATDPRKTTSPDAMFRALEARLGDVVPPFELRYKAEVAAEVNRLKAERGAVILGHNYMEPALFHSVCDFRGDSLELSRLAAEADGDPIVFCGVRFMAETAKILSPDRTVLLPTERGGCSLAEAITGEDVRALKARHPGVPVVTYVNTYAEVKAESDICCTSGNAARIVERLDSDRVILIPDEYLARNVARETGKEIITWAGRCEVHERFTPDDVASARRQFPDLMVLAHPECSPEVVEASDFSGSTGAMIDAVRTARAPRYLLLTECSMADNIVAESPEKEMVRLCSVRCPHMGEITLENVRDALLHDRHVVDVPEPTRARARVPIQRMLELSYGPGGRRPEA